MTLLEADYLEARVRRRNRKKESEWIWTTAPLRFLFLRLHEHTRSSARLLEALSKALDVTDVEEFVEHHKLHEPYRHLYDIVRKEFHRVNSVRVVSNPEEPEFRYIVFEVWAKDKEQAVRGEERFIKELVKYPPRQRLYFALSVSIRRR